MPLKDKDLFVSVCMLQKMNGDLITATHFLKGSPIYDVPYVLPAAIPRGLQCCQISLDKQGPAGLASQGTWEDRQRGPGSGEGGKGGFLAGLSSDHWRASVREQGRLPGLQRRWNQRFKQFVMIKTRLAFFIY